jgi:hypothetical protein
MPVVAPVAVLLEELAVEQPQTAVATAATQHKTEVTAHKTLVAVAAVPVADYRLTSIVLAATGVLGS